MPAVDPVLLYLHIPKAAGTTLSSLLFETLRTTGGPEGDVHGLHSGVFYHPSTFVRELDAASAALVGQVLARDDLRAVLGHFRFGLHHALARPHRYVTLLREPVSRVGSLYHFQRLNEARYGALAGVRLGDDVDLARFVCEPPYAEVDNGMTRRISGMDPPIGACTPPMLAQAMKHLAEQFSVVGLAERFDESLLLMAHALEWHELPLYYPQNVNSQSAASIVSDEELAELIRSRNALDVQLYEFAVELFNESVARLGGEFARRRDEYSVRKQAWYDERGLPQAGDLIPPTQPVAICSQTAAARVSECGPAACG